MLVSLTRLPKEAVRSYQVPVCSISTNRSVARFRQFAGAADRMSYAEVCPWMSDLGRNHPSHCRGRAG
jgi:hypothetical protein